MYDDGDPVLGRLRRVCLALPGAAEKESHGRPWFFSGKGFAVFGGSVKTRPGEYEQHESALLFKADPDEVAALDADARFFVPMYLGAFGWRGLDLDAPGTDWDEVGELVDASYRLVAPRRRVAELDARASNLDG